MSENECLPRLVRTIVATTTVKCSWKKFPYSFRFNTVARSFSLFACRIVHEYSSFQVVCKQPSLEFVRHFEFYRETADHDLIHTITTSLWTIRVPRAQWRDFDLFTYKNLRWDLQCILSDLFQVALKGMTFEEKAKVFVNTFQDFTRDQQNEVLKEILLKCQVCKS